jgi:subfamily B ATP-binding cassette protein HlyB/CyaB
MRPAEVARMTVGGVLNRIDELEKVREFLSTETINIVIGFLSIAIYSIILLSFDFKIVSVPLGFMLLIVAVQMLLRSKIVTTSSQLFESGARLQTFISESVANSKTVKAFGAENVMAKIWDKLLIDSIGKNQELIKLNSLLMVFVEFLTQLVQLSGIWIASMLLLEGKIKFTAGELFAVSLYLQRLVEPLLSIINFYFDYQSIKVSYDKISDIVRGAQEDNEFGHAVRLKGKVKFDRVSFRYFQDGPWILRDVNFSIFPGQIVGIVGKSGSGKTTLASLIAVTFAPTTGKVFSDDYERSFISTKACFLFRI